jgi:uncharacterized membrane protein
MVRLLEPWRTRLLWLSLGLNVFATALLAAPMLHPRPPPGPPSFNRAVDRMSHDLPPDDAQAFREAMTQEQPWYELGRQRLEEAREAVANSITHEPFDPATAHLALQTMQDRMRETAARFDESLVLALSRLSPEGRTRLAESLRRRRP